MSERVTKLEGEALQMAHGRLLVTPGHAFHSAKKAHSEGGGGASASTAGGAFRTGQGTPSQHHFSAGQEGRELVIGRFPIWLS